MPIQPYPITVAGLERGEALRLRHAGRCRRRNGPGLRSGPVNGILLKIRFSQGLINLYPITSQGLINEYQINLGPSQSLSNCYGWIGAGGGVLISARWVLPTT